ncbi:hypothetical protein ACFYY8_33465 [Streptosporangium sp. NPDC001559]|uniref:hypothetical protein n=1 Tax=Streptosporangium sp. NPDC001559 TaxID=3366187 RepID=UPI0036E8E9F2
MTYRTLAKTSVDARARHWAARREQHLTLGPKGVALAWGDQVRALAAAQARRGDHTRWTALAATLEVFCSRFKPGGTRRAASQLHHWESRLAALYGASPKVVALAWWDRARAVAGDQDGDEGWSDLARTLQNLHGGG